MKHPHNPLRAWLKSATVLERMRLATLAKTSVAYLYQIAGGHSRCSAELALALETASRKVRAANGRLGTLRSRKLAPHVAWRKYRR